MKTKTTRQSGFSIVEIFLIIAVLGLAGAIGYTAFKSIAQKDSKPAATQTQDYAPDAADTDILTYDNSMLGITFDYPRSWGEAALSQRARNRDEFEPVKTYFISFSNASKFTIMISPKNWEFTGGPGEWDLPINNDTFQSTKNTRSDTVLKIASNSDSYLLMDWSASAHSVVLKGAKQTSLAQIPAEYAEFSWAPVSDTCAAPAPDNAKRPQLSCYSEELISGTRLVSQTLRSSQPK